MSKEKLNKAIGEINKRLALHGGGVELTNFDQEKKTVVLKLQGACQGCPMAQLTTESFIKKELKKQLPEIKEIKTQ